MATFKWYLNRQGPQGQRGQEGAKGDPGNTPIFSDGQNTPTVYTMIIDLGDGNTFETKNLKYPMRDDGGDYLRYDISEDTVYLGEPNKADLAGKEGEVRLATTTSVEEETVLDTDAVSYELFEDNNEKVTTTLGNLDDKIEDVDDKVDAEADIRARNDGILDNRISLAEGQITSLNNTKASKQELTDGLAGKANVIHTHTLSQITDAGSLAGQNVVDYQSQVINKPIIPTPGNGTITITQGGVTKGTFTTNQSSNSTIELDSGGGGGTTYTAGNGINISNDVISAKVDNDTINFDSSGNLVANIPDVSNFVTNSSLATTLQSYPTNIQLTNTLKNYPTKTAQQNIINYELASWDDFTYGDKELSYAKFPIIGSDECPFYYNEPTGDITATSTGFRFNNNCVKYSIGTYEITPGPTKVRFKAKQGDRIIITSADYTPVIISDEEGSYSPQYDWIIDDGHTCQPDDYFSATMDFVSDDTSGNELNYQIEVLQDCLISAIETRKTQVANPEGTYSFEYIMANNNPAIEFVIPLALDGHIKAIFNPDIAGDGLKINSVNKDRIEVDVDNTTIGINETGQLTYIGTTGDVLPSQTGNSGKFLTTDGSVTSWATVSQADMTQYYTKTQTDSLLDGKIDITAPVAPLEYDNGIEGAKFVGLDSNHIGTATSITGYSFSFPSTSYITINGYNVQGSVNILNALCSNGYVEIPIINNNFIYNNALERAIIFGKYINNNFIMNAIAVKVNNKYLSLVSSDVLDNNVSRTLGSVATPDSLNYDVLALTWTNSYVHYASNNNVSPGAGGGIFSIDSEGTLISRIADSTHIRVVAIGTTTQDYDNIDVKEPEKIYISGGLMQFGNAWESATNMIEYDGTNPSLSLKYDSNTLGVNANNELYALSSAPTNMVTTDTSQTITGQKTFDIDSLKTKNILFNESGYSYGLRIDSGNLRYGQSSGDYSYLSPGGMGTHNDYSNHSLSTNGWWMGTGYNTAFMQRAGISGSGYSYLANNQARKFYNPSYSNATNSFTPDSSTPFFMTSDMLDGTTIAYNSTTNKISAAGSTPTKKTITQASANVSESNGTVTVTDADVTTSTMVSLYPSDTTTETWLTNNLASNIITEGSGSFTFTINGNLPATFSMYYVIQEVN